MSAVQSQVARLTYPQLLSAAWQDHLRPRTPDAPTVISLFAGCGGSSLGYSMAGYRELLAVEWDENAAATFQLNFPEVPVYKWDIAQLSVADVLARTGLKPGELDVLDGSPPCQGFSTAGKRNLNDSRNQLFREYVRLLQGLQPKAFIMENVSGMVKGKMKLVFAEILRELKGCGYQVSARLMNAMYFNVPQDRARMVFVGSRHPSAGFHPAAQNTPPAFFQAIEAISQSESDLAPTQLRESWQMHRVLTGKEQKKHFGLLRTNVSRPAPTIVKDCGNTTPGMIHPSELRRLSIPELKRLASFPDSFLFAGSFREQWSQIGNSVPPLFMRAIAQHVRERLLTP